MTGLVTKGSLGYPLNREDGDGEPEDCIAERTASPAYANSKIRQ